MAVTARPFLMFEGRAQEAMDLYVSLFPDAKLVDVARHGPGSPGAEGGIFLARFSIGDQVFMCTDSPVHHAFTFTPAMSIFVDCADEDELVRLAAALGEGGEVLMGLADYGFSRRFTWLNDRFGVSWQLNLP